LHKAATGARNTIDDIVRTLGSADAKDRASQRTRNPLIRAAHPAARPTRSSGDVDRVPRK
jgi:hypothetical protein